MVSFQSADGVPILDTERAATPGAEWLGPVDPSDPVTFSIRVRPAVSGPSASSGDRDDRQAHDGDAPTQPDFFGDAQEADPRDLDTVCEFANQTGLAIVEAVPAERTVVVSGTAGAIGAAFGIVFGHYLYGGKLWRGYVGRICLPSAIAHVAEKAAFVDDGLPDLVSPAIVSQPDRRFWGRGLPKSHALVLVGGAFIVLGAFVHWRHASHHPTALYTGKVTTTVATRPAVVPPPPPALPISKSGASPQALKALVSTGLSEARASEAEGMPRTPSDPPAVHASAPPLPSAPAPVPPVVKGASTAQPPRPAASSTAPARPQRPLPARGQVQQAATPPSNVPPKPAEHLVPPLPSQAPRPPVPPAPQNPPVQSVPTPVTAPIQAPRAPVAPSVEAPPPNRLYMVRIGPVLDRNRAGTIANQLTVGGFAQVQVSAQAGYRVLSEPLPRKAAESLIATLTARGFRADVEPLNGDTVQVLFGVFTTQEEAEALSGRVAAAGYDAWVREGTVYTLRLGPYSSASVTTIKELIKNDAPEAPVTTAPVP